MTMMMIWILFFICIVVAIVFIVIIFCLLFFLFFLQMDANSAATNGCCFGTLSFRKILDSNKPYTPFCMNVHNHTHVNGQMFEQMMAAKSGTYEPENYSTTSSAAATTTYNLMHGKKGAKIVFYYLLFLFF